MAYATVVAFVVAALASSAASWMMLLAIVPGLIAAVVSVVLASRVPSLSAAGQRAAAPWRAYKRGLEERAENDDSPLDFDATLPDLVAFQLGHAVGDQLDEAGANGTPLRAFQGGHRSTVATDGFPYWSAFSTVLVPNTSAGASSGSTISVATAAGGGAAGST